MTTVNYILVRKCIENDISSDVIFLHFNWSGELLFAAIFWWCVDETHLGLQPDIYQFLSVNIPHTRISVSRETTNKR